jgi:hypothetical protein
MSEALTNFGYAFLFIAIMVGGGVTYLSNKVGGATYRSNNQSLPPSTIRPATNYTQLPSGGVRHTRRVHRAHRNKTRRSYT